MAKCFFYLKTSRFCIFTGFISYLFFLGLNIKFLNTSKTLNSYSKILWFYFITSKDFFETYSSKRKCLDNLNFFLTLRLGSGNLKAARRDWSGNV